MHSLYCYSQCVILDENKTAKIQILVSSTIVPIPPLISPLVLFPCAILVSLLENSIIVTIVPCLVSREFLIWVFIIFPPYLICF